MYFQIQLIMKQQSIDQYSLLQDLQNKVKFLKKQLMTSPQTNPALRNPYQGLINEGSTCYLNSLIQTLFMTPQFRKNVYSYIHNSKKLQQKDSIPYQLQKLFVLLQTSKQKLVTTKGLLKSFQWTQADAFEQHDVQQFCRKLFQAIQIANKKAHWISDLFEGSTMSFVDCTKHKSQKQEVFMDISLPVHNPYTKKQFSSLQECIKEYLRPEKLQDKFHCQECGQKVQVEKGLRINKLPQLLTIQLNRFQLNYQTWTRQKVNSFLYFPELLYMGKFLKNYNEIQISQLPADLKSRIRVEQKQQSARTMNVYDGFTTSLSKQVSKVKPKRKASDQIESSKQKVFFYDQQNKRQKQQKSLTSQQQKQKNRQILANLKSEKQHIDNKMKIVQKIQEKKEINEINRQIQQKQISESLEDDMLFGSGMGFLTVQAIPTQWNSGVLQKESDSKKPSFSKKQIIFEHQQQPFDPKNQYPQNTYALYAVLVHSGGAYGGHYYAYISDGIDWFKFDDSIVRKVNKFEMRKYGNFDKISHGANAYLLFYRDVKSFKQANPNDVQIPQQLLDKVKVDLQTNKQQQSSLPKAQKRLQQILQGVMVKIFTIHQSDQQNNSQTTNEVNKVAQPFSLFIQNRHEQTILSLKSRIRSIYPQLQEMQNNWRLRRYNNLEDTMHEVYENELEGYSLEELGFRETMHVAIQIKNQEDEWQIYDPKQILVKVNLWRPNIVLVTQKFLKPIKINISQEANFSQLIQKIKKKLKIENPLVIKRNFSQSNPIQYFSNSQTKKLIDLRFFNGINLYVQQSIPENQIHKSRWLQQFQSEKYRCLIKYNNPIISQNRDQQLYFDTRKTLKQLKNHLSILINLPITQFRLKKSKQSVSQMNTYNKKLYDLKFIANQFIFLQLGKSSYGAIILKEGKVQVVDEKIQFIIGDEFIVQIDQNMTNIGHIIEKLSSQLLIPAQLIRIRQYKAYQFGQIYRTTQTIQRIKQKSLVWEKIAPQISEMRGIQLYIRVWDVMNLQLGPLKQVYVDSGATYQELIYILQQQLGIKGSKILVWKALSNYVQKQILIDCNWVETCFTRRQIKEQPLYIMNDGQIYIIKESEKEYHARVTNTVGQTGGKQKGKQTGIKITVMAENSDEEEEMIKQAINASVKEEEG